MPLNDRARDRDDFHHAEPVVWVRNIVVYPRIVSTDVDVLCCNIIKKPDLEHMKSP